ncbi:MAG: HupE/UreJ family protein [Rhodospirillales bacterium]|nr:HupE/UreJ family protein [Rhodospirillales bacterium]
MSCKKVLGLSAMFMLAAVSGAEAHVGVGVVSGTVAGFTHPVAGLDHVLAMIAVGVLAAQQGGRALWSIPLAFVAMMLVGGVLGVAGIAVPFVEQGIMGSIIVMGVVVALGRAMPMPLAMAMVGLFAVFHGHAHGTEMPVDASGALYGLGFAIATAMLHVSGIAAAVSAQKFARQVAPVLVRIGGGIIATLGMAMLAGA